MVRITACLVLASITCVLTARAQEAPAAPPDPAAASSAPSAEPPKPAKLDKATLEEARRAYMAGELSYKAGDFKSAIANFKDAMSRVPSPHASYWLGMSLRADGQVPEAIAELEAFLAGPNAVRVGEDKVAEARTILETLKKTPGTLQLTTEPPGARVLVDGVPAAALTPLPLEMAPGVHKITVALDGYESLEVQMDMPPGSKGEQTLGLTKLPEPVVAAAPVQTPEKPVDVAPPPRKVLEKDYVPAYVLFGLAGASAVTGAVFAVSSLGTKSRFDENPTNERADSVDRDTLGADIAFGAAITLGLAGVAVLAAPPAERTIPERTPAVARSGRLRVAPYAGPGRGGASARWTF